MVFACSVHDHTETVPVIARSALSIRAVHLILVSVCVCVCMCVSDNYFYEGEQKAASPLLSTGTLSS